MDHPVLLFDGECNLCRNIVHWIVEHDPHAKLRFARLQSEVGKELLAQHGLPADYEESAVLVEDGRRYLESDAVLRTLKYLDTGWKRVPYRLLPRFLRDWGYKRVSNNRPTISKAAGTINDPWIPPPALRDRFLDLPTDLAV